METAVNRPVLGPGRLIGRSLTFHWRSHLGTFLGALLGSAILVGALLVGESVRASLQRLAAARLGQTELALDANDRLVRQELAGEVGQALQRTAAAVLRLPATAARADGEARANQVQLLGVDSEFWNFAVDPVALEAPLSRLRHASPEPRLGSSAAAGRGGFADARIENPSPLRRSGTHPSNDTASAGADGKPLGSALPASSGNQALASRVPIAEDGVWLNEALARHLNARVGDQIVLRVPKPSQISPEAPLSPTEDTSVALRLQVEGTVPDQALGRFSLHANQVAPFNAFVNRAILQARTGVPGRANLLLLAALDNAPISAGQAQTALRGSWQLADAELNLVTLTNRGATELRSPRVFLDPPAVEAARAVAADSQGVLTYLVNEIRSARGATPYSMMTATVSPIVPPDLKDDETLVSAWLADDLGVAAGDSIAIRYFAVGLARQLEEREATFTVRGVLPAQGPWADPSLMPDFPGLTGADNCRDWDAGFPIKTEKIRDQDERYWDEFRGTPKAFVTLRAGQKLWGNRFGELTAMRVPAGANPRSLETNLLNRLDPASLGLAFRPVRAEANAAASQALDFGQLFLGFSLFLIVSALLLMGLLFQLGVERRAGEVGTLLALGFTPQRVRRLLLAEGVALALLGGVVGAFAGSLYAQAMLEGLRTVWRDAVGTSGLTFHARPLDLIGGAVASAAIAAAMIWLRLRRQASQPARELLSEGAEERRLRLDAGAGRWLLPTAILTALATAALAGWGLLQPENASAGLFFGGGALLLIAGLSAAALALAHAASGRAPSDKASGSSERLPRETFAFGLIGLGLRNLGRRRRRSMTTLALLACGSFLVAALGVFRLDATRDAFKRSSGTGGFALLGETALPVVQDLNAQAGRDAYGLDSNALAEVAFVPLRVRDGEDASCLNLNRAQRPRLLGVRAAALDDRNAFTFAQVMKGLPKERPWRLLAPPISGLGADSPAAVDRPVPAVGDLASIQWALGKKVGDAIGFEDERGRRFQVQIVAAVANSILQGSLLIDEAEFVRRFPSEPGYRMFLIDAPSNRVAEVSAKLSRALQDAGLEVTPASRRLASFNAVQNTYLSTFQALGGLGLLLGSAGLAVVVLRNVLERRGELALLLAVGFLPARVRRMVLGEHGVLLLGGLGLGSIAAGMAVLPSVVGLGSEIPVASLALTLGAVLANGAFWVWVAVRVALQGKLLNALRHE